MGPLDACCVEHGEGVGGHVAERVRVAVLADRCAVERRRQPDVAVVEADHVQAARRRTSRTSRRGS